MKYSTNRITSLTSPVVGTFGHRQHANSPPLTLNVNPVLYLVSPIMLCSCCSWTTKMHAVLLIDEEWVGFH